MLSFGYRDQIEPDLPVTSACTYCYHWVNVISLYWSQSDHIKRLTLYNNGSCLMCTLIMLSFGYCDIFGLTKNKISLKLFMSTVEAALSDHFRGHSNNT
jgi:hypothetical protein